MTVGTARSILHLFGIALVLVGAIFVAQSVLGWIQAAVTMQNMGSDLSGELAIQFVFGLMIQSCWIVAGVVLVSMRDSLAEKVVGE